MKEFVFLYPIDPYFDSSFNLFGLMPYRYKKQPEYEQRYRQMMNDCIDLRYRQSRFRINYAVFDGYPVSEWIKLQPDDRILPVGLDFTTHTTKRPDGTYPYPDPNFLLDQLDGSQILRLAGFHLWDCVGRVAQTAYARGFDTLVDEDLTEQFPIIFHDPNFRADTYPTYDPKQSGEISFQIFMEARVNKHWLWQKY